MNVGFISLGCSKNLVDTEVAIGVFKDHKFNIVNDPKKADIIIINTCGFIESAKEEAINTILEMAEYKKQNCKYLVVIGCLVQRYYDDLKKALPEVDLFIKLDEYKNFWDKINGLLENDKNNNIKNKDNNKNLKNKNEQYYKIDENSKSNIKTSNKYNLKLPKIEMPTYNEFMERTVTTGKNYAYLKIAEGCSNNCTYCAIPYIRGPFVSRKMEDILNEAKMLAQNGIKEIVVIAQDTTKYGIDIYGEPKLAELLQELCKIDGIEWIRFLYSYPEGITDELIKTVKENDKIANYFDIPIQHISNSILKKMARHTNKENIIKLITKIRKQIPDVTLRTSLIVGFPGETEQDFNELLEFVKWAKFDRLGAFMYSKEDGTPAATMPNQVHGNIKKSRYNKLMKEQQQISKEILKNKIGKTYKVLVEYISDDGKYFIGRTMQDAPEEDGVVYIKNTEKFDPNKILNNFVDCKITDVSDYDLIGKII